ncbi:hypothetical protein HLRTI_002918 [Halorhabdus tiamatea SARL4B]|uniref:Uncharacterized protein n=1 Tax=Halorhabdus tiamatea SARL4B TaxID=1033806 RepID=U2F9E1_9EURY|nr:hypothetical protein [Halorhabdus tiamatea]ERJ05119.1 hypothetical protein HLRTI_002918 [Halorhabdus tiamatea SARL4B]
MSTTQAPSGGPSPSEDEKPYMTDVIDGELKTGVLFIPSNGKFYEMLREGHPDVDPETAVTLKDPRSGDTFDYEGSFVERQMQKVVGNHCAGLVGVNRWADFREAYVEADETDIKRANEFLDRHVFGYEEGSDA